MNITTIAPILLSTLLGVGGQLLLKHGMTRLGPLSLSVAELPQLLLRIGTSPFVIGGLLVYVSGTFFWLLALSRLDLSYVYPFASLSYVLIFLASWLLLGEQITVLRVVGLLVICVGVIFVARS